uniref:Protein-lysine N-trimethyltransferase SMYD5 n=2 Tax=Clastoptera arizonana TaxID=38151 RepID=A0A1B6CXX1_9HEMI
MELPGFEVRLIDQFKGHGLFATKQFKTGETIFEEIPLVCCQFAWNKEYGYKACDHCLRPLESALENVQRLASKVVDLPYTDQCPTDKTKHTECADCGAQYCSSRCQEVAIQQYHKILCYTKDHPLNNLVETWKQIHYPPETANIMLLARIIAIVEQAEDKDLAFNTFMRFCHKSRNEDEEIIHRLLGDQFVQQLELLRNLLAASLPTNRTNEWLTPEGFCSLLALVGTNGQGVGTSVFSCWVKNVSKMNMSEDERKILNHLIETMYEEMEEVVGVFLNNEGSALYRLQSCANHSCEPNAMPHFLHNDFTLSMIANRDIQEGEEITISYLDECVLERSRHTRNKILREHYLFSCYCIKCESQTEDLDVTSEDEPDDDEESN